MSDKVFAVPIENKSLLALGKGEIRCFDSICLYNLWLEQKRKKKE